MLLQATAALYITVYSLSKRKATPNQNQVKTWGPKRKIMRLTLTFYSYSTGLKL